MHVRGGGDDEIERSSARLTAATDDGCREPTPFSRDGGFEGERVEGGLDDAEPLRAASSLVLPTGDQDTEVQLGEGRGADRAFEFAGTV